MALTWDTDVGHRHGVRGTQIWDLDRVPMNVQYDNPICQNISSFDGFCEI